jgi:hypothetical protein
MYTIFLAGPLEGRHYFEDVELCGKIILKMFK